MTTAQAKSKLSESEFKTLISLVRLGDSVELAFETVIEDRPNEKMRQSQKKFNRFAYED
jgi:hypothetical protein